MDTQTSNETSEPVEPQAPETGPANEPEPTKTEAPEDTPESTSEKSEAKDERDAKIAELERKLAEAAPILKAHEEAEEARKSELQKANERAEALESELSKLKDEAARARVAEKTGLSSEVVALLNGSTEDELMKAAEKVAGAKSPTMQTRSRPTVGAGASKDGGEPGETKDPAKLAAAIRKRMPY